MRRVRLTLVLVAAGLLVPVGVLVARALEGLALETALRHQTVAERAFDEMERELSELLRAEEERPAAAYRFYADEPPGGVPIRSPLSHPPELPFVVGHFELDTSGRLGTPLRPRDPERARRAGDWPAAADVLERIARTEALVRTGWGEGRRRTLAQEAQPAGTTLGLGRAAEKRAPAREADREASDEVTAYEVLQSFNRALEQRAERKQKSAIPSAQRASGSAAPEAPAEPAEDARRDVIARLGYPESEALELDALDAAAREELPEAAAPRLRKSAATEGLSEGFASPIDAPPAAVAGGVDPLVGRRAGDRHLLLYRTVWSGDGALRQGLVVDLLALGTWLEGRTLSGTPVAPFARARFLFPGEPDPETDRGAFEYQHRFAEPFDLLRVRLRLATLPGVGSPTPIWGLAGLALAIGGLGLLAVHRMVRVVVHFAERRSNFVAAVSHELKTPLTAIRMYAEMLRDGLARSDAKRAEYYHTIHDESERLSRLIDNVLEFSRLERGTREMHEVVGPVGPVLLEAAEKLRPHSKREGFRLEVRVAEGLPAVRYDPDALLQVLFNLVDNAMKYARAAERRTIDLEAERRGDDVVVRVRDWGPGVGAVHLGRVFDPFYRGGDELTRDTMGTGIGLALVRELGERMGAAVSGANAEGGGFRVELAFRPAKTR